MTSREPDLFENLLVGLLFRKGPAPFLPRPESWWECSAPFVDRQGLVCVVDRLAQISIVKVVPVRGNAAQRPVWDAERADCVPDADEMNRRAPRVVHCLEELVVPSVRLPLRKKRTKRAACGCEVLPANEHLTVLARHVDLVDLRKVVHVDLLHQTDKADEAGEAAHRIGAAGKSEKEDLIAIVEIVDKKCVLAFQVAGQADSKRAAEKLIDTVPGSDAGMIVDQLRNSAVVRGSESTRHLGHVCSGARRVPLVPRSIAANYQLAGLRLLGVHDPASLPTLNSNVVTTAAILQADEGANSLANLCKSWLQ